MNKDVYNGDLILIDDISDEVGSNGGQPTTPLGETQMTNSTEEDVDEAPRG